MNNHGDIWKNITMIIFFIVFLFLLLILFSKFKVNIFLEINGTKSYIKLKFLFFELERKGAFFLRKRSIDFQLEKDKNSVKKKSKKTFRNILENIIFQKIISSNMSEKKKKFIFNFLSKKIKVIKFEMLEIYEEIGILEPVLTAYALPIVSTLTVVPLNLLNINYNNFKYKIIPVYTDLKLKIVIKTQISFRLIKFFSIIK